MGFLDSITAPFLNPGKTWEDLQGNWDSFTGKDQARDANEANLASAREQMAFQERMSNTAHQREVKDLEAAGINPMLSAKLGGASSPSGQSAQIQPVPSGTAKFLSTAQDVASVFREQRQAAQSINESQSREDLNRAQAIHTGVTADREKAGTVGRVLGTDLSGFLKRIIQRGASGAKKRFLEFDEYKKRLKARKSSGVSRDWREREREEFDYDTGHRR